MRAPWMCALLSIINLISLSSCAHAEPDKDEVSLSGTRYTGSKRLKSTDRAEHVEPLPENVTQRDSLSLDLLFAYADTHAPAVHTAIAQAQWSHASQTAASFTFPKNPTLAIGAGARVVQGVPGFDYEVALSQTLEVFGEQRARRQTADLEVELAQSIVEETRWLTHVEVHRLVWLLLVTREQHDQAEMVVEFSTTLADLAQAQVETGESSALDVLVAKAELAQAKTQLLHITQQQEVLQTRLAAIIGWPLASPLPSIDATLPPPHKPLGLETLLELLASHHPSLHRRELGIEAQRARLDLARREAHPKPSIGVSLERESAPGNPSSTPSQTAHVGMLTWSLPLMLWRRNQEAIVRAEASVLVARREHTQTLTSLESELRVASVAVEASRATLELYTRDIIPQLRTHFELLERAYELGEVDIHQVSQTRERLLETMTQYGQARLTYFERAATLEGLVGTEVWYFQEEQPP